MPIGQPIKPTKLMRKGVAATGSQTSTNGNAAVPGAGFKLAPGPFSIPPRFKPWIKPWNPSHPLNNKA